MSTFLFLFILVPFAAFSVSLLLPRRAEKLIAGLAQVTTGGLFLASAGFTSYWIASGHATLDVKQLVIYESHAFEFFLQFYFDKITAVFAIVGSALAFLVATFSKFYMHRESGYRRYFSTILFFYFGYNLIVFSGNFETLFTGWEVIGLCSFLLISFYRDRYLPVRNGLKIISMFRLSDICLIVAMWMCHHLWHANVTFHQLHWISAPYADSTLFMAIACLVVLAAVIKSAQFPFTYWLPRAMEGPTSSSAIFYGSLSVHIGVFVLLRTMPLWENVIWMKFVIAGFGLLTAFIATSIAKVQSTVKTQIAYASAAQIGIIFVECAFGLEWLALFHFGANAFLRTYQLLVSPSVMNYLIHDQFFSHEDQPRKPANKLRNTLYMLSIKEWNTDSFFRSALWVPFKRLGGSMRAASSIPVAALSILLILLGVITSIPGLIGNMTMTEYLPEFFAGTAVLYIATSLASRGDAVRAWVMTGMGFIMLFFAFVVNGNSHSTDFLIYAAGIFPALIVGGICLHYIKSIDGNVQLNRYHGYAHEKPATTLLFLLCGLGLIGFPVTTAFVGLDVLLSGIHHERVLFMIFVSIVVALGELNALRIYSRIFLGQHKKQDHPVAFKAS